MKNRHDGFLIQGSIYAASGIISSIIGLMYRLPLTRIIGDEGNGYYSAAFNIYTIILLLSSGRAEITCDQAVSSRWLSRRWSPPASPPVITGTRDGS